MSRSNNLYKERYNDVLASISTLKRGANLPPETELSKRHEVSRTTVRSVLEELDKAGIIRWVGRQKVVLRKPRKSDFYPAEETQSISAKVEGAFMEFVLRSDLKPGAIIRESDLARDFEVSASAIREFLIQFSSFGLIEKKPNRHWVLLGFTRNYANELFDVREIFETRAITSLAEAPLSHMNELVLERLRIQHEHLLAQTEMDPRDFAKLDEATHKVLIDHLSNRFVDGFYEVVALIFHYHYHWNKSNERQRNQVALKEHLDFINALLEGDSQRAISAFKLHLTSARRTLHESVVWED